MKSKYFVLMGLLFNTVCFSFGVQAHAIELEATAKYPVAMGAIGSGFSPMLGFGAGIFVAPILDPAIKNYLSVAYQPYRIKADGVASLAMFPILANLELPGKVFSDFYSTLGVGLGATVGFVNVPTQTSYSTSAWFTVQIKPGFEWIMADSVSVVGHTPVTFLISSTFMSSMDFDLGLRFKL